jgi:hypothetical protein
MSPEKHIERAERLAARFDEQVRDVVRSWGRSAESEASMAARKKRTTSTGGTMPDRKDDITVREREVPLADRRRVDPGIDADNTTHVALSSTVDAITRLRAPLLSLIGIGGVVVTMLVWFGWQNYSPGSRIDQVVARVDTLTKAVLHRDSVMSIRYTYLETFMRETAYSNCFANARTTEAKASCADKYLLQGGAASGSATIGPRR